MARAAKTAAETEEVDYTPYATKPATDLQGRFAAWIPEATGYDPSGEKTKQAAFEAGVRLGTALRMQFQASPENQEVLEERKKAAAAKKAAPKSKRGRKAAAEVEEELEDAEDAEETEDDDEPEEPPAKPARRTRSTKATTAKATATKTKTTRGRKAAVGGDAPF